MTKRDYGKFKRRKQDAYDTPKEAVTPLIPHLPNYPFSYWEPCAGKGALVDALPGADFAYMTDIEPRDIRVSKLDALKENGPTDCDLIITKPPWTREILHPMIERFSSMCPTWLLFDADWMHTKQAKPYLNRCEKIVSVGRVSWMQNGVSGLDNCAWYLFTNAVGQTPLFYGRT